MILFVNCQSKIFIMRHFTILTIAFAASVYFTNAQDDIALRTTLDPAFAPFYHGVASGDPLTDRVIIWTRVTPDQTSGPADVQWEISTDTLFNSTVNSGTATTDAIMDFTVKVDADNLQPDTWYYYRFKHDGRNSIIGRTRTAPQGSIDSLRFAVVSCSDYVDGYFHGYRMIANRNDIDAVIHLGDYIYENGSEGTIGRPHEPLERINELADYRQRYSQYRLDPDLRIAHQMYPFINVWDDHEIANNAWSGGAEAHDDQSDGPYEIRKRMAVQAYFEWIPIRKPDPSDTIRIYRSFQWGDLLDLFMIDTRIIGRDEQTQALSFGDTSRYMLGREQLAWLSQQMDNSTAQWKVIGQQVMIGPLNAILPLSDQWNGYKAERDRLYDTIVDKGLKNIVVLTGDIHTAWANNLEHNSAPIGVEFVCSSITTQNAGFSVPQNIIQSLNPFVKYVDLDDHGYYILDVNKTRTQADFYQTGDRANPTDNTHTSSPYWYTNNNTQVLAESQQPAAARASASVLQPSRVPYNPQTGIETEPIVSVIGTYPNPFWENFVVKTYLFESASISVSVFDEKGALVRKTEAQKLDPGLHYVQIKGAELSAGSYQMQLSVNGQTYSRTVIKL